MNCTICGDEVTTRTASYLPGDAARWTPLCPTCYGDYDRGVLLDWQKHELPPFVTRLLHELYHPLGKRRMQEAFRPFARALQDAAKAFEAFEAIGEKQP